jgi:hypothetical protein
MEIINLLLNILYIKGHRRLINTYNMSKEKR